jgi:non-heme chloroperoxidase
MSATSSSPSLTDHEGEQLARANASGRTPVVFVHGLWLLPSSWDNWTPVFDEAGYSAVTPGWPDDPETVEEANANPEVFAHKSLGDIAEHIDAFVRGLNTKPAVIGHSFGGLLTQIIAGRGLAAVSVSALKAGSPVLGNPLNRHRAVPLTYEQFRYGFANAVEEAEAKELYEKYAVPGSGEPLFQAAAANLNPWTEAKVDTRNPDRGPLLIISGELDHTVPHAIAHAEFKRQEGNEGLTEFVEVKGRGHALTIDSGWREVADTALAFVKRYV